MQVINSRLAMLGFVAAVGAELATGTPVSAQLQQATVPIIATFVLFSVASLIPHSQGAWLRQFIVTFHQTARRR